MYTGKAGAELKLLAGILVLALFASCPVEPDAEPEETSYSLDTKPFWARDLRTGEFYRLDADLLVEGEYCKIWVEQASRQYCDSTTAQKIADEYDCEIYPKMIAAFSIIEKPTKVSMSGESVYVNDIMGIADFITDGDGKLCILLLDIRDDYTELGDSYTAGYFYAIDFFEDDDSLEYRSNESDMIYLDTYPAIPGSLESCRTLAHEMQHLINFATTLLGRDSLMDTWIDEGLSSAAEYIYLGKHIEKKVEWFNKDSEGTIALGNNFFVWGNLNNNSILDDYATVYLFFQWLRLQSEGQGNGIYKDIIASTYSDYIAVMRGATLNIPWFDSKVTALEDTVGDTEEDIGASLETLWKILFESWLASNYINAGNGEYGYKNDTALKNVKAKTAPTGTTDLGLLPGEAVYSITDEKGETSTYYELDAPESGTNIKYLGLSFENGEAIVDDTYTFLGGALLTYNSNTTNSAKSGLDSLKETGRLTGESEPPSSEENRFSLSAGWQGTPERIDARDMLARNGRLDALKKPDLTLKDAVFNARAGGE
jgi:hypothetical protein